MAITYGSLRRLGFSEARVEECLQAISGVELEEAIDWVSFFFYLLLQTLISFQLYFHLSDDELGIQRGGTQPRFVFS